MRREVGERLRPRFAVGDPGFPVGEPGLLADGLGKLPRGAALREPAPQVVASERRGCVIADRGGQEQLAVDVEGRLTEPRGVMNHLLRVDRKVLANGVGELEGRRCHETPTHRAKLPHVTAIQLLPDRYRPAEVGVERISRGAGDVMVNLVVDDLPLDYAPVGAGRRRRDRAPLEPLVRRVVGA